MSRSTIPFSGTGPFEHIRHVNWGGIYVLLDIYTPYQGPSVIPIDPELGTPLPPENVGPGAGAQPLDTVIDNKFMKSYAVLSSNIGIVNHIDDPGGEIVSWTEDDRHYPDQDTGSLVGLWDSCADPDTGFYLGDDDCVEVGGVVPHGGVARHDFINAKRVEFTSDPLKRVWYSRQGSPDKRFFFIDDRIDWSEDTGVTEAVWHAALLMPYDRSFFKAERAIVSEPGVLLVKQISVIINFSYSNFLDTPPRKKRPVKFRLKIEEPEEGGYAGDPNSKVHFRRFGKSNFKFTYDIDNDGLLVVYNGKDGKPLPKIDQTIPIKYGSDGIVAEFDKDGFIDYDRLREP